MHYYVYESAAYHVLLCNLFAVIRYKYFCTTACPDELHFTLCIKTRIIYQEIIIPRLSLTKVLVVVLLVD